MKELNDHYEPEEVESNVKQQWKENDVYQKVKNRRSNNDDFYFLDGPPFTSGRMHCGTAWGKIIKDAFLRYYRMQGYNVLDRPGYDTHGLPIEVKVEQEHEFETKQDIEDFGLDEFVDECKQYVEDQKSVMDDEFQDMGVWMDWDNPYVTMSKDYMNTVWNSFKQLHKKGLIDRGFDVLNTCPRCQTTLSDSELDYSHRTVESAYIGFRVTDMDAYLVAWTTTPWTVVGNQFVAVDKEEEYAYVKSNNKMYIVADKCVENFVEKAGLDSYSVVERTKGDKIVGWEYEHPLSEAVDSLPNKKGTVQHAEYVEAEKTGLVHSAPGFGHEDYERGKELGLHPYSPVQNNGVFSDKAGKFSGNYVHKSGTNEVLEYLNSNGNLIATERYNHEYPECPRCDTDVVFRATKQWFFKSTNLKEGLQSAIDDTDWYPSEARDERFRNTVKNAPDWNISRQRYWGTPIPVWVCEDCDSDTVVGSSEELEKLSKNEVEVDDLHRPEVDPLTLECQECGGNSHRISDVLDVWFDSSVASWGSLSVLPEDNPRPAEWPSDLIIEGHDQTRGWFLMQLYVGVALADKAPYKDVLMHGFALLDGEPMSKSRGHVLRPPEVIDEHGRDAMRGYMLSNEEQENDVNMTSDMQGVESLKKKLDILWNVYRFSLMYMNEDSYTITQELQTTESQRATLDNWILSRLDSVIEDSTTAFEKREPHVGLQSVLDFLINDVSRYYVKTIRDRVWVTEDTEDKESVYDTLGTLLYESCRLLAPFTPYLAEELYNSLPLDESTFSVHDEEWPETYGLEYNDLETEVEVVRKIEESSSRARDKLGRKQRWPVLEVTVETSSDEVKSAVNRHEGILKDRLNTYHVNVTDEFDKTEQKVQPMMDKFGPRFKQDASKVADQVEGLDPNDLPVELNVDGTEYVVEEDLVEVVEELEDNVERVEFEDGYVYLSSKVTDKVRNDGITRDVIRRSQEMRSQLDLYMDQQVDLSISSESDAVMHAVNENIDHIMNEVRVNEFKPEVEGSLSEEFEVEDSVVRIEMEVKN